jgi:hypothetical protein
MLRGRTRSEWLALALLSAGALFGFCAPAASAVSSQPTLVRDVRTGSDTLGTAPLPPCGTSTPVTSCPDPIQDYVQPDTEIEPSIAVNPANPLNVVTVYQEGRIADAGDATNGFATSFDGGKTWTKGELPGLTSFPRQGGPFERASDAVVAFGPNNIVYANSLVFDQFTGQGLRSGIAVNVSKDGGRTWEPPVFLEDDLLGGLNDKNWIAIDMGTGPGHHFGRVYAVWDRVAPVVYDYCDKGCDQLSNWLPNLQTVPGLVFPGQGIGAYPVIQNDGGLGIVVDTVSGGVLNPAQAENPDVAPGSSDELVYVAAPAAGSTPYPAPLAFLPPVDIATNQSTGVPAQRAGGLPAAAVDTKTGTIYAVWEDGRFRSDGANDVVMSSSTGNGVMWSPVQRINPGSTSGHLDHYNPTIAVDGQGTIQIAYRVRDESGKGPLYSPAIDTYYQRSTDGGTTFTAPLKVDIIPSNAYYDAFSRDGSFEGDYDEVASWGGFTYIVRCQGEPAYAGEPAPLIANPDGSDTLVLTESGKGHQHQSTWVALVRDRLTRHAP